LLQKLFELAWQSYMRARLLLGYAKLLDQGFVRVINDDDFHQAYRTQPGDKMYLPPTQRVRIWP
jgi:hypothetical protein